MKITIDGPVQRIATSNDNGWWRVSGVPLGTYRIQATFVDSTLYIYPSGYLVTLTLPCQQILHLDFALAGAPIATPTWIAPTPVPTPTPTPTLTNDFATIAGRMCADKNEDGACQDEEPGIEGIVVTLDPDMQSHMARLLARTVVTDPDGYYRFEAVDPGQHRLRFEDPTHVWLLVPVDVNVNASSSETVQVDVTVRSPTRHTYFPHLWR